MPPDRTECLGCGAELDPLIVDEPCPACGALERSHFVCIHEDMTLRDGNRVRARRPWQRKPYVDARALPSYSYQREKLVYREVLIDRDNDRYVERVTDYETGEVIHFIEEPLTAHVGHGSAKTNTKKTEGSDR